MSRLDTRGELECYRQGGILQYAAQSAEAGHDNPRSGVSDMQRIGIIGLGIMGGAIARNLIAAGFKVSGFDLDQSRASAASASGVAVKGSAAEATDGAELVLTSLPSTEALDITVTALAARPQPGLVLAEISTFPIAAKEKARDRLAAAGITALDCPLSGTGAQAQTRDLALYGSGDEAAFVRCRDALPASPGSAIISAPSAMAAG